MKNRKYQRDYKIIGYLLCTVLLFAVILIFIDIRSVIVVSGSMEPKIMTGSLCFIEKDDGYEVKKGDIIAFKSGDTMIIHRVVAIKEEKFITKGDNNKSTDPAPVYREQIKGKYICGIPKMGYLISEIKTKKGIAFIIILAVFLIFIGNICKAKKC